MQRGPGDRGGSPQGTQSTFERMHGQQLGLGPWRQSARSATAQLASWRREEARETGGSTVFDSC